MREVILPKKNQTSLRDLPDYATENMTLHFVSDVGDAIRIALASGSRGCYPFELTEQSILPLFSEQHAEYVAKGY